jgi:hypothetical protein
LQSLLVAVPELNPGAGRQTQFRGWGTDG